MTENDIAKELIKWRNYHMKKYPCLELLHHIFNEGRRNPSTARAVGILGGLPDYHMPVATTYYNSFWMELKAPKKKPTKKQFDVMIKLRNYKNYVTWVDNVGDAIELTEQYCQWVHG
ncbi:MAG: hypothetical protein GY847_29010 [Proteobacteria bacterium]|nr:hypothetical protein [Pseudomonadota bacterium]